MHRLFLKLFLALSLLAGSVFGFAPDASAHLTTSSAGDVSGNVRWNGDTTGDLDGCDVVGNPANLPLGIPGQPQQTEDRCFEFDGLIIHSVGWFEGTEHATAFAPCDSTGVSTANAGRLGSFYGEFDCEGNELTADQPSDFVQSAQGHFHGLSRDSTIAFLGTLCDPVGSSSRRADPAGDGSVAGVAAEDPDACVGAVAVDPDGDSVNTPNDAVGVTSSIKHTLACKGEVVPGVPIDTNGDDIPDAIADATVALECVIA